MSVLVALPLLPLLAAVWFVVYRGSDHRAACWVTVLASLFAAAVALLATDQSLHVEHLLIRGQATLVLDTATRPALLLFAGLWLSAALIARNRADGPEPVALLIGLAGALVLALSNGGPLVFASMAATAYGLYAITAGDLHGTWRGRLLIGLLIASDLLIFELLLHQAAAPDGPMAPGFLLLTLLALLLRSGTPPAHTWLPAALSGVRPPTAILLAGTPAAAAFIGAARLLAPADDNVIVVTVGVGLAGAVWCVWSAAGPDAGRRTLGHAASVTAALLLVTIPAIATSAEARISAWIVVSLTVCCSAVPVIGLQRSGRVRSACVMLVLACHGLAAAQAAMLATRDSPAALGLLTALIAAASTLLLTMALANAMASPASRASSEAGPLALVLGALAAAGLPVLWQTGGFGFDSFWPAPVGITAGLMLLRTGTSSRAAATTPRWQERARHALIDALRRLRSRFVTRYPVGIARLLATLAVPSRIRAWSDRIAKFEYLLGQWPATALLALLLALAGGALLTL